MFVLFKKKVKIETPKIIWRGCYEYKDHNAYETVKDFLKNLGYVEVEKRFPDIGEFTLHYFYRDFEVNCKTAQDEQNLILINKLVCKLYPNSKFIEELHDKQLSLGATMCRH